MTSNAILVLVGCVALGLAVLSCYSEYLERKLDVRIVRTTPENDDSEMYPYVIQFRHGMSGFTFFENLIPWHRNLTIHELNGLLRSDAPTRDSIDGHHEIRGREKVICFMRKQDAIDFSERVTRLCRSRADRKPRKVVHSASCDLRVGECARDDDYSKMTRHQRQMQQADKAIREYQQGDKG